jgi:hypothetical protein
MTAAFAYLRTRPPYFDSWAEYLWEQFLALTSGLIMALLLTAFWGGLIGLVVWGLSR